MHELFLRHTKSRNTIVKRWEWCWLQSWQGQVAFWSAWLGMFYNISACHQQAWASHTLAIQSGPSLIFWCRALSRLNSQSVALACWGQHDIIENAKPCTSKCNLTLPTLKPAPLPSFGNCVSGNIIGCFLWHLKSMSESTLILFALVKAHFCFTL